MYIHVVQSGETIWGIASYYGVSAQRLVTDNGIRDPEHLVPGQALVVLIPEVTHTVRSGETLQSIAAAYQTTVMALLRNNPVLTNRSALFAGETLTITFSSTAQYEARVNGYAYPHIDKAVLEYALPFLTYLTIFGYGFRADGSIFPTDDEGLIQLARLYDTGPVLLLSSVTENGTFSSTQLEAVLADPAAQNVLIQNLLQVMRQKQYVGIDMDFEYIAPTLREEYLAFIQKMTVQMNAEGFFVNVDLAPKTSSTQKGLLYEAHDYGSLGAAANTVFLMTYEWGHTNGPPMPVAPLNRVEEVVRYALTEIPSNKIMMGIPNYGYVWRLPYQKGVPAHSIGNVQAVEIALQYGASISFDEEAQSSYFCFSDEMGIPHVVWFEDARSIQKKLRLAEQNYLRGVGYWNLMRPFPQNWAVLNMIFKVVKVLKNGAKIVETV